MVPFEAIAIPLYNVANSFGMVDTYAGMIIPAVANGLVTFLFIQFFKDIPPSLIDVGRILRTFKIKKNVEVTDNGKIII